MQQRPLVSVVIPAYNAARFLPDTVKSVLAQTYAPVEVIVVDDGSTDDTVSVLEPLRSRIHYVHQENGGVSRARNRGIKEAKGELIAFLDADDQWLPQKLERQVQVMSATPDAGLVHTDIIRLYDVKNERVHVPRDRGRFSGMCYAEFFWGHVVTTSTVMIQRKMFDTVGFFDEEVRGPSTEDMDLWMRIARLYPLAYINEPLVVYRHHPGNGSGNLRRFLEDEYYVLQKVLRQDRELWQKLDQPRARKRMYELAFGAGYQCLDAGDFAQARRYLRSALTYAPANLRAWAYLASTLLPGGLRRALRQAKQGLTRV